MRAGRERMDELSNVFFAVVRREHHANASASARNRRKDRKIRKEPSRREVARAVQCLLFSPNFDEADRAFGGVAEAKSRIERKLIE